MVSKAHFEICVKSQFSAAHHLKGYKGTCEKQHGHNWNIQVFVQFDELNNIGIGIDFCDVKRAVQQIVDKLDHTDLNTLPQFQDKNPSSENIAAYLYRELSEKLTSEKIRVTKVGVNETPNFGLVYWEE